jgi:hypothetical protein
MSFADIINATAKQLEQGNNDHDKVQYPQTKQKPLYFEKGVRDILVQVLPSADLVSMFAVPVRKIFLTAMTSQGKQLNSNFTLDAEPNPGSLLEAKITEWQSKQMLPNGFGGQQSPRRLFLVNAVRVIQNPANTQQWVQERDQQGNLVIRKFELPQSAFQNLLKKLADPLLNVSGSELSFMDINRPSPVKISKPAKGQMEYPVEVYNTIILPPLGQGWENLLEDLNAQAVPTERLVNGEKWVQAFIDMKEGRKPNQGNAEAAAPTAPAVNPYAQLGASPVPGTAPVANPYAQPQANPYAQPQPNPYAAAPQPNPYAQPTANPMAPAPVAPVANPYVAAPAPTAPAAPVANPYAAPQAPVAPAAPVPNFDDLPETDINTLMPTGMGQPAPTAPAAPAAPHVNANGLNDIDAMLAKELGNI